MIIQPSRRQRRADPRPLHLRLARSRLIHRRLFLLAAAALVASVAAWLLGLALEWQLGLMLVAGLLSLLYPLRGNLDWALAWIEAQAGLSYRTALELSEDDPYGFAEAVRVQAQAKALRVEAPPLQPWWLPLFLLAFAFAFLPQLGLPGGVLRTPLTNPATPAPGTPPPSPPTPAALPDDAPLAETEAGEPPPPPEGQDAAADTPPDPGLSRDYDTPGSRQEATGDAPGSEDALSRFLEGLSEPPPPPPPPPPPQGGQAQPGGNPNPFSPVSDPSDTQEGEPPSDDAQTTPGEGEGEEGSEAEPSTEAGEGEAGDPSEESPDGSGEGEEGGDEPPLGENEGEEGAEGEEGQQPGGAADGSGDQEGSPEASDGTAEGAGSSPSLALPTDELEGEPEGPPELLTGVRQEGPVSRAGETLLPGSQEDSVLPSGAAPDEFQRSVERAIAEGRIPVEYQEILRNYFR